MLINIVAGSIVTKSVS